MMEPLLADLFQHIAYWFWFPLRVLAMVMMGISDIAKKSLVVTAYNTVENRALIETYFIVVVFLCLVSYMNWLFKILIVKPSKKIYRILKGNDIGEKKSFFVAISGSIGVGKTTLCLEIGNLMKMQVYEEAVTGNKYLDDFYENMKKYSFHTQVSFLNQRYQQHKIIDNEIKKESKIGHIQDRTIYEDKIFATILNKDNLLDERDYQTYLDLLGNMLIDLKMPDIIIYLKVSPENSLTRIKTRYVLCY